MAIKGKRGQIQANLTKLRGIMRQKLKNSEDSYEKSAPKLNKLPRKGDSIGHFTNSEPQKSKLIR